MLVPVVYKEVWYYHKGNKTLQNISPDLLVESFMEEADFLITAHELTAVQDHFLHGSRLAVGKTI